MKLLLILTVIYSMTASADFKRARDIYNMKNVTNKNETISYELYRSKYFFSSTIFALRHIKKKNKLDERFSVHLEKLINKTGPLTFYKLIQTKRGEHNSGYQFLNGYFNYLLKNDNKSILAMKNVQESSLLKSESEYILGSSKIRIGKDQEALINFKKCQNISLTKTEENKKKSSFRYYKNLQEMCLINQARIMYKQKKYQEAINIYNKIDPRSYRWPYTILEKAWCYFQLQKYNRVLGLLTSYKSPLLQSYFNPESEYLTALSYYKLCHYNDSKKQIDNYFKIYKKESDRIKNIFLKKKKSLVFFFNFMLKPIKEFDHISPFMRIMMTQVRKSVRFNLELHYFKMLSAELDSLKKDKKNKFNKYLIKRISKTLNIRVKYFNHFIKKKIFSYLNGIHRYSYELFNLKLNVLTKSRELIEKRLETKLDSRFRGNKKFVEQEKDEKYWTFNNEFWADELGSYSFALNNNCLEGKK